MKNCKHTAVWVHHNQTTGICEKCKKKVTRRVVTEPEYTKWKTNTAPKP